MKKMIDFIVVNNNSEITIVKQPSYAPMVASNSWWMMDQMMLPKIARSLPRKPQAQRLHGVPEGPEVQRGKEKDMSRDHLKNIHPNWDCFATNREGFLANWGMIYLAGGLVAIFWIFPYIGFLIIPIDELRFFRTGWPWPTNQLFI